MSSGPNDDLGGLDEIDIDSILEGSIGTSGKPSVPSAHEPLPSLFDEDIVDVESLLAEISTDDIDSDENIEDIEDILNEDLPSLDDTLPTDVVNELSSTEPEIPTPPANKYFDDSTDPAFFDTDTPSSEEPIPDQEEPSSEPEEPQPAEEASPVPKPEPVAPSEPFRIPEKVIITALLTQESEAIQFGHHPIPDVPDALPPSSTRQFLTHPKRPLSYIQKRSMAYATGIILWVLMTTHIGWKAQQLQEQRLQQLQDQLTRPKPLIHHLPQKISQPSLPAETNKKPVPPPEKPHKKEETVPPPQDADQKDGLENPQPLQCKLTMDSTNVREELQQCLRSAKLIKN